MSRSGDMAVGMMDTAYFVGRGELLNFFNSLLGLQLTKIEQTASGAVACQLTEYIYPGSIPMSRVNWEAKSDYEFINNYKLLQAAFTKRRIKRHVDVDKLIRAKYQDNLEFCQWLKAFHDQTGVVRDDYDPSAVRAKGKGGKKYNDFLQKTAGKHGSKPLPAVRNRARPTPVPATRKPRPPGRPQPTTTRPTTTRSTTLPSTKAPLKASENRTRPAVKNEKAVVDAQLMKKNAELELKVEELESAVVDLEKERDFYFSKLRNVELMLQVQQDKNFEGYDLESVVGSVFKVLYATVEEDIQVSDEGEIIPHRDVSAELNAVMADEAELNAVMADYAELKAVAADEAELNAVMAADGDGEGGNLVGDE